MSFDRFKGKYIKILDWTFFKDESEANKYRETYSINDEYELVGTTIVGDVLAIKGSSLIQIDHENPVPAEDFELSNKLELVQVIIDETLEVPDYEDCEDIKKLKSIKKRLKKIRKSAPENLKDDFETAIEEIEDEIDFLKD